VTQLQDVFLDLDRAVSNALLLHIVDRRCANEAPARSKKLRSGHVPLGPIQPPTARCEQKTAIAYKIFSSRYAARGILKKRCPSPTLRTLV
jgi:hypothetical protein